MKQACKYNTGEAEGEARESLKVWSQHGQHMKFQVIQEHSSVSNIYILRLVQHWAAQLDLVPSKSGHATIFGVR